MENSSSIVYKSCADLKYATSIQRDTVHRLFVEPTKHLSQNIGLQNLLMQRVLEKGNRREKRKNPTFFVFLN